jgi:hypothetical protein
MVSNGKGPSTFDGPKPDSLAQRPALRASGPASRSIHQFGLEDHQLIRAAASLGSFVDSANLSSVPGISSVASAINVTAV